MNKATYDEVFGVYVLEGFFSFVVVVCLPCGQSLRVLARRSFCCDVQTLTYYYNCCYCYYMPRQANREDAPYEGRYAAPQRAQDAWVPPRPGLVAHLAKMQDFQGEGSDRLDSFFDHVEELADFYRWDSREICHQVRAHLRGTALAYAKRAPFQPRTWEELKALLLK